MAQERVIGAGVPARESIQQPASTSEWDQLATTPEFKELLEAKKRTIIPATIFFIVYYFALPVSVGYFPDFMDTRVIGNVNLAYLFALSQFFVAWAIAAWYTNVAGRVYDKLAAAVRSYARGASR